MFSCTLKQANIQVRSVYSPAARTEMVSSDDELRESLERHNAEFESLLRLIPAKYYLAPEDKGEQVRRQQSRIGRNCSHDK